MIANVTHIVILGAGGNIAQHVIDLPATNDNMHLTLFLRNARRLRNKDVSHCRIIEGDVLNMPQLNEAVKGQDIVYANLAGELELMAKNIVEAMEGTGVKKLIFVSSMGSTMFR